MDRRRAVANSKAQNEIYSVRRSNRNLISVVGSLNLSIYQRCHMQSSRQRHLIMVLVIVHKLICIGRKDSQTVAIG